jgi:hypothetical protein
MQASLAALRAVQGLSVATLAGDSPERLTHVTLFIFELIPDLIAFDRCYR